MRRVKKIKAMELLFNRFFKNNNEYKNFKRLNYIDSLAYTVQEILYTDEACDEYFNYNLVSRVQLYDFMSLVVYFIISASKNEYGKAEISGYISAIETQYPFLYEKVEYTKENYLNVSNASQDLVLSIIWVAYIYVFFRSELNGEKQEMWNNAKTLLFSLMQKESGLDNNAFEKLFLIKKVTPAIEIFVRHWNKNNVSKTADQKEVSLSKDKSSEQNNNVQLLQLQLDEARKKIVELEQEVKDLKEDEEEYLENIDANQKIRMEVAYRLMRKAGLNPHTIKKQRAAEFISILLGIKSNNARGNKAQTCATYLSARLNDTKKNAFAFERYKNTTEDVKSRAKELGMDITLDDDPA